MSKSWYLEQVNLWKAMCIDYHVQWRWFSCGSLWKFDERYGNFACQGP